MKTFYHEESLVLMFRRSERLEKINKKSVSNESSQPNLEGRARKLGRQKKVDKRRSASLPILRKRTLSSASREDIPLHEQVSLQPTNPGKSDLNLSSDNLETDVSVEWDPSYDKCSPLKDTSDILDLTIANVAEQVPKDRSDSVAHNTAPADFAILNTSIDSDEFVLPIPSLLTVPGLSAVLETSEEEIESSELEVIAHQPASANTLDRDSNQGPNVVSCPASTNSSEEDLRLRLRNLINPNMEETDFKESMKELRKGEITIKTMLKEFTAYHVTFEDREG